VAEPFLCTRCSTPLDAPSATGLCPACALASQTRAERPADAPPRAPDTPQGLADGTPVGPAPNPFAATRTGPDLAPTAPRAPESDLPADPDGFTLIRPLGGGGMGDVYLAHEEVTNRVVAVKFLRRANNDQLLERFKLEFRALANLSHPNAVAVYTYKFEGPAPFYAMELLEGGSVADRLRAKGPLAAADAVELIRKVAGAVKALHEHRAHGCLAGVVHRDIKPGNILLTKEGEPKLADFGLVKYLDAETITHTLQEVGTAQYMPPEQFNRANGEVSYASDVYSLGATLYHLLTGCPPFTGETVFDVRDAVLTAAPVRVRALRPEVPLALEAVVLKCLAKDPAERYQTVGELLAALDNPDADSAPRYTRAYRARLWLIRHARAVALAAAVLVAVPAVAVAVWPERTGWDAVERDLDRDKRAVLVPGKGMPRWHRTHLTPATLGPDPANEGACAFQTTSSTQVELVRAPRAAKYRVTFELRQLLGDPPPPNASMPIGTVGVYFGHQAWTVGPWTMTACAAVRFTDFLGFETPDKRPDTPVRFGVALFAQHPDRLPTFDWLGGPNTLAFDPKPDRTWPGLWRKVWLEVEPDRVQVRWWDPKAQNGRGAYVPLATLTSDELNERFAKAAANARKHAPEDATVPTWNPRNPIGVFAYRGTLAVRDVVIEID